MKKKLLATVLTLALSLTIVQPATVYAAGNEKVTQAIAAAEEKTFDGQMKLKNAGARLHLMNKASLK